MPGLQIAELEIQGFRSFGPKPQTLAFPSPIAAVRSPNSHGKTSLAEAFEFLLTGNIVRRELLASSQDEFAGALRNAHLPTATPVFVRAVIALPDGKKCTIKRTLISDYGKREECRSALEVDGAPATEQALTSIGFVLSQPPLRAPVLAQHTLGYLFSARPQDRATYFKAVLELTDLESFRAAVAALDSDLVLPIDPLLSKLEVADAIQAVTPLLAPLKLTPTTAEVEECLSAALAALIAAARGTAPAAIAERIAALEQILADKRSKTFSVGDFDRQQLATWTEPPAKTFETLETYVTECTKIDEETRRLTALFEQALALPTVASATEAIDCPLCATENALTPARVAVIRRRLEDTDTFRAAQAMAGNALAEIASGVDTVWKAVDAALPRFMRDTPTARRERGFRMERIRELLGPAGEPAIVLWLADVRRLVRLRSAMRHAVAQAREAATNNKARLGSRAELITLRQDIAAVARVLSEISSALPAYLVREEAVAGRIRDVIDAASHTTGWQELIGLARSRADLCVALVERSVREQARKELEQALKQIDKANEQVLDAKFQDLSADVEEWWNLLRPSEMSFFAAVKPRPGARRTIDFKAGLATTEDRSDPKLRDVIAVFSQSQLHCLGLALFIARSVHEGASFELHCSRRSGPIQRRGLQGLFHNRSGRETVKSRHPGDPDHSGSRNLEGLGAPVFAQGHRDVSTIAVRSGRRHDRAQYRRCPRGATIQDRHPAAQCAP
jgi:hypothetical protein